MRDPFTLDATGATLTIRATPKASKTAVTGVVALEGEATALGLRVAAPPVDGAANDEVVRFVAKQLRVGRGSVTLVAGQTSRVKRLRIEGDAVALEKALRGLLPSWPFVIPAQAGIHTRNVAASSHPKRL